MHRILSISLSYLLSYICIYIYRSYIYEPLHGYNYQDMACLTLGIDIIYAMYIETYNFRTMETVMEIIRMS